MHIQLVAGSERGETYCTVDGLVMYSVIQEHMICFVSL